MPTPRGRSTGRCSICLHGDRYRIELALVSGVSKRAAGKRFGVSPDAAWRHLHNHVPAERRAQLIAGPLKLQELAQKATEEGLTLLDYLTLVRSGLVAQFLAANEADDRQGAALISGRLLECLRIMGQFTGELQKAGAQITTNIAILQSPLMADLQGMLLRTLQPYPEARAAVLAGLEELSSRATAQSSAPLLLEAPNG
ncbi:MAG: hypothetical protein ACLPTF_10160 [Steroidobacteraceae bacterium]